MPTYRRAVELFPAAARAAAAVVLATEPGLLRETALAYSDDIGSDTRVRIVDHSARALDTLARISIADNAENVAIKLGCLIAFVHRHRLGPALVTDLNRAARELRTFSRRVRVVYETGARP